MKFCYFLSSLIYFLFALFQPMSGLMSKTTGVFNPDNYQFDEDRFIKPFTNTIEYQNYSPTYPKQPNLFMLLFLERYQQKSSWELPLEDLQLARSGLYNSILSFNFNLFWESSKGIMEVNDFKMEINLTNFRGHLILESPKIDWPLKYKNEVTLFWHTMTFSLENQILFCNHSLKSNLSPYNQVCHWLSFDKLAGLKYVHILINKISITHFLPTIFQRIKEINLFFNYQFGINDEKEWDQILQNTIRDSELYTEFKFNDYFTWPTFSIQQKRLLKIFHFDNRQLQIQLSFQKHPALKILDYYLPTLKLKIEVNQTLNLENIFAKDEEIIFKEHEDPSQILFDKYPEFAPFLKNSCVIKQEKKFLVIEAKTGQNKIFGKILIPIKPKVLDLAKLKKPQLKNWILTGDEKDWIKVNEALFEDLKNQNQELSDQKITSFCFIWNSKVPEIGNWEVIIKSQTDNHFIKGQLRHQIRFQKQDAPDSKPQKAKMGISLWWLALPFGVLLIAFILIYSLKKRKNRSQQIE